MSPLLRSSFGSLLPSPTHRSPGELLATCSLEEEGDGPFSDAQAELVAV